MKKTLIAITGSLIFSALFYRQSLGINMLLFALITVISVFILHKEARRNAMYIMATLYIASALFVFTINSALSIFTCIIAFVIFSGSISGMRNSIYVQWFNGLYQLFIGTLHRYIHRKPKNVAPVKKHNYGFIALTSSVVLVILLIFISLYGKVNPILGDWISKINLSFLNFTWIITTLMAYVLLNNLLSPAEFTILTTADRNAPTVLQTIIISDKKEKVLQKEQLFGTVLLIALNGLILFFVMLDIAYIASNPLQDAAALSKTVHEGVSALIISIIIAITIILILFRGDLNFYKKNEKLRLLTYAWIVLNIIIILLTAYKNYVYSSDFGLTYKRIGVFIYLSLSITGMVTTYFKIARKHNFLFMVQANARAAFLILIIISSFSWDRVIAQQNLAQVQHLDMHYLLTMESNTADILYTYAKANPKKIVPQDLIQIETGYRDWLIELSDQSWKEKTVQGILHSKN